MVALRASFSTTSAAGLVLRTKFVIISLLMLCGTIIVSFMIAFSIFSISLFFQIPPATMGVPRYINSDLPKLLMSYSVTLVSASLMRHLRNPMFLLICFCVSFIYRFLSATSISPKYLTSLLTSMPSMHLIWFPSPALNLRISHFLVFTLRL